MKLFVIGLLLSLSSNAFSAQFKAVKEDLSSGKYNAEINYPQLLKNSVPAYSKINKSIRELLLSDGCEANPSMEMGYHATATVVALNTNYVGLQLAIDYYCGGVHPDFAEYNITYNSQTGELVKMAFEIPAQESEGAAFDKYQTNLASIIYKHMTPGQENIDCFGTTKKDALTRLKDMYPYASGLAKDKKIILRIEPPHAMMTCGFSVRASYEEMKPYLAPNSILHKWLK